MLDNIQLWIMWHNPKHYYMKWYYKRHPASKSEVDKLFNEARGAVWDMQRLSEEQGSDTGETIAAILQIDRLLEKEQKKNQQKVAPPQEAQE